MILIKNRARADGFFFRCFFCNKTRSIRHGSLIERSKLSLQEFIWILYFWATKTSMTQICIHLNLSEPTVIDWLNIIREICSWRLLQLNEQVGGEGKIVQVDESLLYKAKNNVGHALYATPKWILGFYDVEARYGFSRFIPNRKAETLLPLIKQHIKPGSVIHTDCFASYSGVSSLNVTPPYVHLTVNHSANFVDPITGCHTNNVESYWASVKDKFKRMRGTSYSNTPSYLDEHEYFILYGQTPFLAFKNIIEHISLKYHFE
jgi:transposase-like protein